MPKNYTVVKIGNMASTHNDALVELVQFATPIQNGSHVVLGDLIAGGDLNTYQATLATDVETQELLLIEEPVLIAVEGMRLDLQDPRRFINEVNRPIRARRLRSGDSVTITSVGFTSLPTVGQFAVPVNGELKLAPATSIGDQTLVYKVELKTAISIGNEYVEAYKLKVIKSV